MSCFVCCENVSMPSCVWFEGGEKRNIIASIFSGLMVCICVELMIHSLLAIPPPSLPNLLFSSDNNYSYLVASRTE